ncbi:MAG: DNA-directed RNA polymerase subunit K [Sulfolobaceae archaeon]
MSERSKAEEVYNPSYVEAWSNRLTRYERARIISARALQLAMGAPPLIDLSKYNGPLDPISIAEEELKLKVLPITIRRRFPNGIVKKISIMER